MRLDRGCYLSETDKPGLPAGKWEPEGACLRQAWLQDVVIKAAGTQMSPCRPTVQKRGERGGGGCGPRETGHGARPAGSAQPGCRSLLLKRVGHGPVHPSVEGSGCVHPAASQALLPRYPTQAWSPLEAARNQGPKGPAFPTACTQRWSAHNEEGRRLPPSSAGVSWCRCDLAWGPSMRE